MNRRDFVREASAAAVGLAVPEVIGGCVKPAARDRDDCGSAMVSCDSLLSPHSARPRPSLRNGGPFFGAMVSPEEIVDPEIQRLVIDTCDILVVAGGIYWGSMEPSQRAFDYRRSERTLRFAVTNGLLVRGHTLVYHTALPGWLEAVIAPDNGMDLLLAHVHDVVSHFRGRVNYWDVVNEVVRPADGRRDRLRNSIWMRMCGPQYIPEAIKAARNADPMAQLGYNEFGIEDDSTSADEKRAGVLQLLRSLRRQGIVVDYLGIQSHLAGGQTFSKARLGAFIEAVRELDVDVHITELDVNDRAFGADPISRDRAVADVYSRYLDVVMPYQPATVTTWGLSDRHGWPQQSSPRHDGLVQRSLPFDVHLEPKQAWRVLREAGWARKRNPSVPRR